MTAWLEYHDRTESNHLEQVAILTAQGFRPLSLSTYGNPKAPLYAAVWVKRGGTAWKEFHGLSFAQLKRRFTPGFKLSLLSVAGSGESARFAGVLEKNAALSVEFPMSAAEFLSQVVTQKQSGKILKAAVDYGSAQAPRYIAIYENNPGGVLWNFNCNMTPEVNQQWLDAMSEQWARPSFTTRSASGRYIAVYRDDQTGPSTAHGELTSTAYELILIKLKVMGYYPSCVQGAGEGQAVRFTAIFVKNDLPLERKFTIADPASGKLAAFDSAVETRMKASGVRSGVLAVAYKGKLVLARGYTWAEPTYPVTKPTSRFRIGSCSKPLTSIAVHQLIDQGKLTLDDGVQEILHTPVPPGMDMDPRYKDIKVWHLLSHSGGRVPFASDFEVRDKLGKTLPISKYDVVSYMAGKPLDFTPGSQMHYSNFGYGLLGQIIEKTWGGGKSYEQLMQEHLWNPLGISRPRIAGSRVQDALPDEVHYHDWDPNGMDLRVGPSVVHSDGHLVPGAYGTENYRNFDSFGGWVLAAPDYAKVLASFDLDDHPLFKDKKTIEAMWSPTDAFAQTRPDQLRGWGLGRVQNGTVLEYYHGGVLPGALATIFHRSDGVSIAAFFNGNIDIEGVRSDLNALADNVSAADWPTGDLFPQMGIGGVHRSKCPS